MADSSNHSILTIFSSMTPRFPPKNQAFQLQFREVAMVRIFKTSKYLIIIVITLKDPVFLDVEQRSIL